MPPTSRRLFLYWLLLLVPALVVGTAAVLLLRNEQRRIVETGEYAAEARRAAVGARLRLIVENVELLVGDIQTGLLDSLAAETSGDLAGFLDRWEKTNPLVRLAFLGEAAGRITRPDMRTADEKGKGFLRRCETQWGPRPPWVAGPATVGTDASRNELSKALEDTRERKDVSANVAQVQSARRAVQELFSAQNQRASAAPAAAPSTTLAETTSAADGAGGAPRSTPALRNRAPEPALTRAEKAQAPAPRDAAADRRGWAAATMDGRLHLLGWVQPGGNGEVRGVEVELAALVSRLAATLPAEAGPGEGYALRDDQGRILHQAGAVPKNGAPAQRIPVSASLLPGWDAVAYVSPTPGSAVPGHSFFWAGVLLVCLFVGAILAGGALLVRQARRSEQEAAQKTSFVANVSHEFKTPLTTIRLYAELLEQGRVRDGAQGTEYLRTIGRETQRLARLVNNALDFSRLEQGRKQFAREPIDLGAEVARFLATHAPRVAEAGLVLKQEGPETPVRVTTDRDALGQILLNLVDNACKYAADGGEIAVTVSARPEGGAEVRVADRGPGVPSDHQELIFEKFHRVDSDLTAEKSGAGLGLSIARQLARGLGGDLRYAPRRGAGAEFILTLP